MALRAEQGWARGRYPCSLFRHLHKTKLQEATCPGSAPSTAALQSSAEKDPATFKGALKGVLQEVKSKGEHGLPPATHPENPGQSTFENIRN